MLPCSLIYLPSFFASVVFSVSEIAHALLASCDSIEKRLGRARKLFRLSGTFAEITNASEIPERLPKRLEAVYQAIYLLFNEGYHGSRSERKVREDLCFEAIRLALLLSEHPEGEKALHCAAPTYEKTEWAKILELYNMLYRLKPSPIDIKPVVESKDY